MIQIYNTLTKKVEEFKPLETSSVSMYSCGPTVYNLPHIGNYRAFLFNDILRRTLGLFGYSVLHVMNITDVDDKTIQGAEKEGKTLKEFTEFYTNAFNTELDLLNILPASLQVLATDHIKEMVEMIETLKEKGFAYTSSDGSTYFNISHFERYGELSGLDVATKDQSLSRIVADEYEKDSPQDFALWKAWTPEDGENFWESSLGKGRPGWHIECSAMSTKYLGNHFDIHTGGIDLTFPHHENERAQSMCATGELFANFWLHNEHILVDGQKMSKSKGNQYTLSDIIEKGYSPLDYRYFVLSAHYRSKINLTWEALDAARNARIKLSRWMTDVAEGGDIDELYLRDFKQALGDDLNTPQALAVIWELVKDTTVPKEKKKATILMCDEVLGLELHKKDSEALPEEIQTIINERDRARAEKDFTTSDNLRVKLESLGYDVLDTPQGTKVYKN